MSDDGRKFVPKAWGFEDWIVNTPLYCGKLLFVKKGKKCSWHYHKLKDETFYVQSGRLVVRYFHGPDYWRGLNCFTPEFMLRPPQCGEVVLEPGDKLHVPPGTLHQFEGLLDTHLFEFSTEHKDEDSIRVFKGD